MHINFDYLGITVPGYVLVISNEQSIANWSRCSVGRNGEPCVQCVIQLDNVSCVLYP